MHCFACQDGACSIPVRHSYQSPSTPACRVGMDENSYHDFRFLGIVPLSNFYVDERQHASTGQSFPCGFGGPGLK